MFVFLQAQLFALTGVQPEKQKIMLKVIKINAINPRRHRQKEKYNVTYPIYIDYIHSKKELFL